MLKDELAARVGKRLDEFQKATHAQTVSLSAPQPMPTGIAAAALLKVTPKWDTRGLCSPRPGSWPPD